MCNNRIREKLLREGYKGPLPRILQDYDSDLTPEKYLANGYSKGLVDIIFSTGDYNLPRWKKLWNKMLDKLYFHYDGQAIS
tara:strand:+ start:228 stop:470 length:243 start_codon:yes stop_codon:yes gene_type:complete